jgi:hypothetical protein
MTTLLITPKVENKTAKFKGTIAAGEHVAVTIKDGAEWDEEGLTLRVIDFTTMRTLAVFPRPAEVLEDGEEPDAWETTQSGDLTCTLNLNTVRMVNAARHMIHVPVLFVLGNSDEDSRTLYFRDRYEVELWPERIGDDVPYDLDKWPKQIDEWTDQMEAWANQMQAFNSALSEEAEARASGDAPLSGQVINTNTANALRQAVKTIGAALGATMRVLAVCAAFPLLGATVQTAPLGELDLDQNPSVVTNVTFEGLLTEHQDISGKADKTNTYTKAETDAALGAFAATGSVARATVYGTPTRWTDATGCVWEVITGWRIYTNGVVAAGWTAWNYATDATEEGTSWALMIGIDEDAGSLTYSIAEQMLQSGTAPHWASEVTSVYNSDVDYNGLTGGDAIRAVRGETNLVGRVALTNDIPPEQEWPAELVHTNTPLIFADGEDTNVTSIALRAQPENYTSLSFLSPVSYYLPNRFSLLELGHDYQIAAAQWFQVGRYLYAQNPENIVFVGGERHKTLQEYLDACSPQTMADLLSCYIPTNGGGRIHGDLTIDGRLTAGELITITNSDIHAKGFQVVNKVLTADGLMASNGMVRLNCARFVIGFGTPRIHLETNDLSAITYGGTWEHPAGSVFSWQDSQIQNYLAGNIGQQDIELRNPYMRYMDVKDGFLGWKIKGHNVNNGPLKHFMLDNYRTHHFTDADVGNYGIEFTINSNAHVRIVYDFETTPPSAVYFACGRVGNDESATMLSNGTELLAPTAGTKTLLEIEHLSGWTFIVKETPLTYENTVMPWIQAQEEEP